jgi:hypothetical protein
MVNSGILLEGLDLQMLFSTYLQFLLKKEELKNAIKLLKSLKKENK